MARLWNTWPWTVMLVPRPGGMSHAADCCVWVTMNLWSAQDFTLSIVFLDNHDGISVLRIVICFKVNLDKFCVRHVFTSFQHAFNWSVNIKRTFNYTLFIEWCQMVSLTHQIRSIIYNWSSLSFLLYHIIGFLSRGNLFFCTRFSP